MVLEEPNWKHHVRLNARYNGKYNTKTKKWYLFDTNGNMVGVRDSIKNLEKHAKEMSKK